jgi:hypothetical protein
MPATCHHKDERLFDLAETFVNGQPGVWDTPWLFYVWGHAYEFEAHGNWDRIERFCEQVSGRDDVWYATNMEIYEYVESFKRLVFTLDQTQVKNPTAQDLWFNTNGKLYHVPAGKTVYLD